MFFDGSRPSGLLRILGGCPELLLESFLGESLEAATVAALLCVHSSVAALPAGGGASLLWRLQLRRLRGHNGSPLVAAPLLAELPAEELKRATKLLGGIVVKSNWGIETRQELVERLAAIEAARSECPPGAVLFGLTLTCCLEERLRWGGGGEGEEEEEEDEDDDDDPAAGPHQAAELSDHDEEEAAAAGAWWRPQAPGLRVGQPSRTQQQQPLRRQPATESWARAAAVAEAEAAADAAEAGGDIQELHTATMAAASAAVLAAREAGAAAEVAAAEVFAARAEAAAADAAAAEAAAEAAAAEAASAEAAFTEFAEVREETDAGMMEEGAAGAAGEEEATHAEAAGEEQWHEDVTAEAIVHEVVEEEQWQEAVDAEAGEDAADAGVDAEDGLQGMWVSEIEVVERELSDEEFEGMEPEAPETPEDAVIPTFGMWWPAPDTPPRSRMRSGPYALRQSEEDEEIRFPSGVGFKLALALSERPLTRPMYGLGIAGAPTSPPRFVMRPLIVNLPVFQDIPEMRGGKFEAYLWSAAPGTCDFERLGLMEELLLSPREARRLLGSRGQGRRAGAVTTPSPLHVVATVRCTQRFWDVALQ